MVTTIDTREHTQHRPDHANSDLDIHKHLSGGDSEPAGYIVYLTEIELFEAYPRAKRENPGALVHFDRHDDDVWSLQVYKSEAARHAFLNNFFGRLKLLSSLTLLGNGDRHCDA